MTIKEIITRLGNTLKPLSRRQAMICMLTHQADGNKYRKYYFSLFNVRGDWQIERLFCSYKRRKNEYDIHEVERNYFNVKTHKTYHERRRVGMFYVDGFKLGTPIKFSKTSSYITGFDVPNSRFHKDVRKRGYDNKFLAGTDVIEELFKDNWFEYLYKTRSPFCRRYRLHHFTQELKDAIKIANRHHIDIDDTSMFADTIRMMSADGKDTHSPVLLKNWKTMHELFIRRQEEIRRKKAIADELKRIENEKQFSVFLSQFSSMSLVTNGIKIVPLLCKEDYIKEGDTQHICVGGCGYYGKDNTIILSARTPKGNTLATIEYNVVAEEIVQCRGFANKVPERDEDIRNLILSSKSYIRQFHKQQKTKAA